MILSDVHTHSLYCDGKDSLEDMILSAIGKGFEVIGLSGHAYTPIDTSYCIRDTDNYFAEARRLAEKYKDKIKVLVGLEADLYSMIDRKRTDYIIVSVYYLEKRGAYYALDCSAEGFGHCVTAAYGGDALALAEDYFQSVVLMQDVLKPDIIGHFDLIAKYNDGRAFFDENDKRYVDSACAALDILLQKGCVLEMNTGAVSRGVKKTAYPSDFILKRIKEKGSTVLLSSDAHSAAAVGFGFENCLHRLESLGFSDVFVFTDKGLIRERI